MTLSLPIQPGLPQESAGKIQRSPLEVLLPDAVYMARKAESLTTIKQPPALKDIDEAGILTRSAILSCAHIIEAVANCCLERDLSLPTRLLRRIKRWPTSEKIDFYLHEAGHRQLDWGSLAAQQITELIDVRNSYVHPDFVDQAATVMKLGGSHVINPDFTVRKLTFLKIPKEPRQWGPRDAIQVLRVMIEFLDVLFLDVCQFDSHKVARIVCDRIDSATSSGVAAAKLYDACYEMKAHWGIEPRCMKWMYEEMDKRGAQFPMKKQ